MTWREDGEPAPSVETTQAREAARKSTELAPDVVEAWLALAAIAVHEGDVETFRKVRRDVLARFSAKPYPEPATLAAILCTVPRRRLTNSTPACAWPNAWPPTVRAVLDVQQYANVTR